MESDLRIDLMMEAVSPITHMSGTEGNEAVLMREPVVSSGVVAHVPVLTGNALRHRAFRQSGYLWLISRIGLAGKMTAKCANFLLNGGAVSESTRDADLRAEAEAKELIPLLAMLGGCLPNQIIPGRAQVGRGLLACRENSARIRMSFPDWAADVPRLRPADDFVGAYQYTRGEASRYVQSDAPLPGDSSNLMIFSGESVIAGAVFFSRVHLRRPTDLQAGAMLHALRNWDGTIGGQSSHGHGRFAVWVGASESTSGLIEAYESHVDEKREEIAGWLSKRFA